MDALGSCKCKQVHTSIRSARICDATKPLAPVKKTLSLLCDMVKLLSCWRLQEQRDAANKLNRVRAYIVS
jgi:hypothetical protein